MKNKTLKIIIILIIISKTCFTQDISYSDTLIYYYPSGEIIEIYYSVYNLNIDSTINIFFYKDGQKQKENILINYDYDTSQYYIRNLTLWYENGKKKRQHFYINGMESMSIGWYETGILSHIHNFKDNKLDGNCSVFGKNGNLLSLRYYKSGMLHGYIRQIYETCELEFEGYMENGTGQLKYYRKNGSIRLKENFKGGRLNGKRIYYKKDGSIDYIDLFENGRKVKN